MGKRYLIDTNVVIAYLDSKLPGPAMKFMHGIIDEIPNISVITKIELLRFNADDSINKVLNDFVNESVILGLIDDIVDKTISICKEKRIKLPDGIIAATALNFDLTLLTRNISDFKNISGLKSLNPWEL